MKAITALLLVSGSVMATPAQQEQQINMLLSMMDSMGELSRLSQCVNLPPERIKTVFRQMYTECGLGDMMSDEANPAHQACLTQGIEKHSGIAAARWEACDNDTEPQDDPLLAELEALSERIGEREPTAAEQQQMDQIIAQMQQRGVAGLEQMVDGLVAGSQGSESMITLPLYPQAQLLINIPARGVIDIAEQQYHTLPGASFISTDSPQQVLQFYQQQLRGYQIHRPSLTAATDIALMKTIPAGFDYSRDTGRAFSIPHIYIQPATAVEQRRLAGAKTLFFIYYPPTE